MAKKLSQGDQKDWKKRLIVFAAHVNAFGNATVLLKEVESGDKSAIVASATDVAKGFAGVFDIFKQSYAEVEAGNAPGDFTANITSPGGPPDPPSNTAESVMWFQGAWGGMQTALNRASQKSPKIAELMQTLGPSAVKLCGLLQESYGDGTDTPIRYRSMATFNAVNFPEKFVL